jgi:hypothetical protein
MNECRRCDRPMGKHPWRQSWRCSNVTCPLFDKTQLTQVQKTRYAPKVPERRLV